MYDPVMNGGISFEFTLNKLHFSTFFFFNVCSILVVSLDHFVMQETNTNPLKDFGAYFFGRGYSFASRKR